MTESVVLYRPVGTAELRLIEEAGWRAFPPRLPEQPIFHPVTNEAYAAQIARDWNAKHNDDKRGYVTRFEVRGDFLSTYRREVVGGREHEEYWIPAEDLHAFNAAILADIEVVAEFDGKGRVSEPEVAFDHDLEMSPYDPRAEALARQRGMSEAEIAMIKAGLEDVKAGRTVPHDELMARIAAKHGW